MNEQKLENVKEAALNVRLADFPVETVAAWYCELNCFRWPENLPIGKPYGWDSMTDEQKHVDPECNAIWRAVSDAVPEKEKSRAWHMHGYCVKNKTYEEFEAWWAARSNGKCERSRAFAPSLSNVGLDRF